MVDKWFISDTHWGHENILKFCPSRKVLLKRGTMPDMDAHNQGLIDRWNKVVGPKDIVYHLGDVAFGFWKRDFHWMRKLKGRIKLLRGNHDTQAVGAILPYVDTLLPGVFPLPGLSEVVLSHAPIHPMCLANRWRLNVHGHIHESRVSVGHGTMGIVDKRYMNVAVEQIDFTPVHWDVVVSRLRQNVAPACDRPGPARNLPRRATPPAKT